MHLITKNFTTVGLITFITLLFVISGCKKDRKTDNGGNATLTSPMVLSLSVYKGPYNTQVDINGKNFGADAVNTKVWFNNKAAKIIAVNATKITVTVPLSAGTGKVSLSVSNGATVFGPVFSYVYTMMVTTLANSAIPIGSDGSRGLQFLERPAGIAVDNKGNVFVSDFLGNMIYKIDTTGKSIVLCGQATQGFYNGAFSQAMFNFPYGLAIDHNDNIYIADRGNWAFRKIGTDNMVTTFASSSYSGYYPNDSQRGFLDVPGLSDALFLAIDKNNTLYYGSEGGIYSVTQTGQSTFFAGNGYLSGKTDGARLDINFGSIYGLAFDDAGNLFIADWAYNRISKIGVDGNVTLLAGNSSGNYGFVNGKGTAALFSNPTGLTVDAQGNVYISEPVNKAIRKITPDGTVTTFAGTGTDGNVDGSLDKAMFSDPEGLAIDGKGIIYVADGGNNKSIRKIGLQ